MSSDSDSSFDGTMTNNITVRARRAHDMRDVYMSATVVCHHDSQISSHFLL